MNHDAIYTKEELKGMIVRMEAASNIFYGLATKTGNHPFIEFTGLMNEYIQICRQTVLEDIDFSQANTHTGIAPVVKAHNLLYIAEKLDCIFGPTLKDPKMAAIFTSALLGHASQHIEKETGT